jgi:hypothetical protein
MASLASLASRRDTARAVRWDVRAVGIHRRCRSPAPPTSVLSDPCRLRIVIKLSESSGKALEALEANSAIRRRNSAHQARSALPKQRWQRVAPASCKFRLRVSLHGKCQRSACKRAWSSSARPLPANRMSVVAAVVDKARISVQRRRHTASVALPSESANRGR